MEIDMKEKMITISTQIALFFDSSITRPDNFYNSINAELGELIDTMPQTLPLPPEAPPEIPRVFGSSSFGKYSLNVSLNRVDLVRNYSPAESIEQATNEFKSISTNLIVSAMQKQKIDRIGIVSNFYIRSKEPQSIISKLYLNDNNQNSDEISIRLNKRSKHKNIVVNNVVNINQGTVTAPDYDGNAVIIQLDYNTDPQEKTIDEATLLSIFNEKSAAYSYLHAMEMCGL